MSSTEQALRTRLGKFLNAVNDINSLGFEEVYTTPPPNFPTARAMVVEIESEDSVRADGAGYENDSHANKRTFNLKIACVWGEVDPSDQAMGVEEKVYTIKRAIEQSSWLLNEDNGTLPEFQEIHVTGIDKRYNPVGYMEGGIISLEMIYYEAWVRDNTLSKIWKPDIYSAYLATETTITVNWYLHYRAGIKVYISETDVKPATATATLAKDITTYTFTGLTASTTYYVWVEAYNEIESKESKLTTTTS